MTAWINSMRRWLGFVEHPPATSGATSILFTLQASRSPLSFEQIRDATRIMPEELTKILEALEWEERITCYHPPDAPYKSYAICYPAK